MEGPALAGVITDGDIRRALERAEQTGGNPLELRAAQIMTSKPATIDENDLALDAAGQMETRKITFLVVTREGSPCGIIHIHDLLTSKVL
jgi:arabinose-5-phosphate isomerase